MTPPEPDSFGMERGETINSGLCCKRTGMDAPGETRLFAHRGLGQCGVPEIMQPNRLRLDASFALEMLR